MKRGIEKRKRGRRNIEYDLRHGKWFWGLLRYRGEVNTSDWKGSVGRVPLPCYLSTVILSVSGLVVRQKLE